MQTFTLEQPIAVLCERAHSFPEDIMGSYERLEAKLSDSRTLYGLSRMENNVIVYLAAAAQKASDDAAALGCEEMVIPAGLYVYTDLANWRNDIPKISKIFDELCATPGLDPQGYCIEWYMNQSDMRCMIRLAEAPTI